MQPTPEDAQVSIARDARRSEQGAWLAGRYRLQELLGAGGMGEVWRATDERLGRVVAIKLMQPALLREPGFAGRFRAEARAMASVEHPAAVTVHDFHDDASVAFLVMEYVQGEALSDVLHRVGRLPVARTLDLTAQAADALQAVHDRGIVHRDVKPANLLLRTNGALVLTDFGIARISEGTSYTVTGMMLGTPSYLAPEQVLGQPATARSDVYALGLVAYECLTGRRPFDRVNPYATAVARLHEAPPSLPAELPEAARAIVERALATDPVHRWTTAADLAGKARSALAGSLTAQPTAPVVLVPAVETTAGTVGDTAIVADAARTPNAVAAPGAATRAEAAERRADTRGAVVVTVSVSVILLVWLLVALLN